MDLAILQQVLIAEAIFHHKQRNLIAVIILIQHIAEAHRVDGPAPGSSRKVRVLHFASASHNFVAGRFHTLICSHCIGVIVAETKIIHAAFLQNPKILLGNVEAVSRFLPLLPDIGRIMSADMHVRQPKTPPILLLRQEHILRTAAVRVVRHSRYHTANLKFGIDLMAFFHCQRAGGELIMGRLVYRLFPILPLFKQKAGIGKGINIRLHDHLIVDLVEGQPIFHLILIALHHRLRKARKETDESSVPPPDGRASQNETG